MLDIYIRYINSFPPSVPIWHRFRKTFDFNFRRDHQKIYYERRDYESVDVKSPS